MTGAIERTDAQRRADALGERANALLAEGRWPEALPLCEQAVALDPGSVVHQHNLGILLTKSGRVAEGETVERRALALAPGDPRIAHSLGHNLLAQGRLAEGWPLYAARALLPELNTGIPTDFPFPRWQGEPLAGKRLTIFPEQGFGDQFQFVRFLPQVAALGGQVTLLTFAALVDLFRHNFPDVDILAASGAVEFPDPDYWTTLYDLPALLGATLETLPAAPYLRASRSWPPLGKGFKVGLKLKGNVRYGNEAARALSEADMARLRRGLPGKVISLEPEDSGAADFADTAAMIEQLDLVVSRDTSVAHLAGAMGKPCFLLVPGFSPDWRWMWGRDDSPWYGRHRLFRGAPDGSWSETIDRLLREVKIAASPSRVLTREAAALRDQGRFSESLAAGRKAVAADPANRIALHNLGRLLTDLGRLKEGETIQRRLLKLQPDDPETQLALALNLLAQGRYAEAWPLYEARTRIAKLNSGFPQNVRFPRWAGEDIGGERIAIFPEQGFGDQLQFARFLPWLEARCAGIVLLTPPPLVRLFERAFPATTVAPAIGAASFPKCAVWTTLSDLPALAGVTLQDLPDGAYLRDLAAAPAADPLRIGVMTSGNPRYVNDAHRSLPPALAERLRADLPGQIVELDPKLSGARDFAETASIMSGLDVIVSVDTSVGHLAGVLAKPCMLLVSGFATDWRWRAAAETSPWYPRHRLFRGGIDGDWGEAIGAVAAHVHGTYAAA